MALVIADRVLETCAAPGTSTVSLLGATTGYQSFASAIGNGNTCYYTISDQSGANWEVGIGTVTAGSPNTLSRDTVLSSSNAGAKVNFSSGTQNVFVTYPAEKSVNLNASGNVSALGTVSSATWNATTIGTAYGGTNQTAYTSPASSIAGLIWYDGTSFQNDTTTSHVGYNPSTNTFYANNLVAAGTVTFTSTGAVTIPVGTTAQQPTGVTGMLRFNSTLTQFEGYNGSVWTSVGGGATGGGTDKIFVENGQTVTTTYAIPSGQNAMSTGPITINAGVTVTVPSGSRWVVL